MHISNNIIFGTFLLLIYIKIYHYITNVTSGVIYFRLNFDILVNKVTDIKDAYIRKLKKYICYSY